MTYTDIGDVAKWVMYEYPFCWDVDRWAREMRLYFETSIPLEDFVF